MTRPSARSGTHEHLLRPVAAILVNFAQQPRFTSQIVHQKYPIFSNTSANQAFAQWDSNRLDTMSDLCPKLICRRIDEPKTASISTREVPCKVRIESDQFFDLLLLADTSRMFKNRARNMIGADAVGYYCTHYMTFRTHAALK